MTEQPDKPSDIGAMIRRLGPVGPLALAAAVLPAIGGIFLLANLGSLGTWLRDHAWQGAALYAVCFAVTSGFALLPTYAQAILGGWAFGLSGGTALALIGIVVGALIGFLVARRSAGDRVTNLIDEHVKWKAVYDALVNSGAVRTLGIVTLLRLPPNSPFAMTNLVMAATKVPLGIYALGTLVGIAPRTALAVYFGSGMESLDDGTPGKKWMFFVSIGISLVIVMIIGQFAQKALHRVANPSAPSAE